MKKQNSEKETGRRYKLGNILQSKEENKAMTLPQKVEAIACYVLESKGCLNSAQTMIAKVIIEEYKKIKSNHKDVFKVEQSTFQNYLSALSRDNDSPIAKQEGKNGYFLNLSDPLYDVETNLGEFINDCSSKEGSFQEYEMYPILTEWLKIKGGHVKNIGAQHPGKKWTNPDVLGIKYTRFFEEWHIEVTTIEAKVSSIHWRYDIFQAVAHTMFANRVYFAYLCDPSDKVNNEMILYAQKFGVGIISIAVPNYKDLKSGSELKTDYIKEILPAVHHNVDIMLQKNFLDKLNIQSITDILELDQ